MCELFMDDFVFMNQFPFDTLDRQCFTFYTYIEKILKNRQKFSKYTNTFNLYDFYG